MKNKPDFIIVDDMDDNTKKLNPLTKIYPLNPPKEMVDWINKYDKCNITIDQLMKRQELLQEVKNFAQILDVPDLDKINEETILKASTQMNDGELDRVSTGDLMCLGWDSLDMIELVSVIEEKTGKDGRKDIEYRTVKDVLDHFAE